MTIHMNMQLIVPAFSVLFVSGTVFSAEPMSADGVKSLLTNNTMNCKNPRKQEEFVNYYRDDGTVTKLTSQGEIMQGKWRVTEDGKRCQDWGKEEGECCFPVVDKGNGVYQKIENGEPITEFTMTEGNSHHL